MPCISYDTEWIRSNPRRTSNETALKNECDRLARIACKAMTLLEQLDPELKNFKDTESRKWWSDHKKADKARMDKEAKEKAKIDEQERLREAAMAKLTPEEIQAFGLKLKKGKK